METTIDISKALEIDGWMSPHELQFLAEQAQKHERIIEIGSYLGRSTRALCDNTSGTVTAIDDWYGPRDFPVPVRGDKLLAMFCDNLRDHVDTGKLYVCRRDLDTLQELPAREAPDMIFIDADHTYESVKHDLDLAFKAMPHGLLCGHDFGLDYPGVLRALLERVEAPKHSHSIWYAEI